MRTDLSFVDFKASLILPAYLFRRFDKWTRNGLLKDGTHLWPKAALLALILRLLKVSDDFCVLILKYVHNFIVNEINRTMHRKHSVTVPVLSFFFLNFVMKFVHLFSAKGEVFYLRTHLYFLVCTSHFCGYRTKEKFIM